MTFHAHDTASSHFVASSDEAGLQLHIRAHADTPERVPVLFVHGASYASRLYDIPHTGASWLKATAEAGFAAYALDVRGYGLSRSAVRDTQQKPYARAADAIRDIDDAIGFVCARHGVERLRLVGGSWGTITTALYASTIGPERVERLLLYAPIFAERNEGWLSVLRDPQEPASFNRALRATRLVSEAGTRMRWDAEIPQGAGWRDEAVFQALVQSTMADDPLAARRTPPAFASPNGTFCDLWEAFNARPLYAPQDVTAPAMLIRGSADETSTRTDALALLDRLGTNAKRYLEISDGSHFLSAERRCGEVFAAANAFLAADI
ncbi:MAG: alpha/beta fold hydrolase [Pseudomonadota bacterium]